MSISKTPQGVRYNNRYRGPHESKKINPFYSQARFNINKIKEALKELESMKNEIIKKPDCNISKIVSMSKSMEEFIIEIKKCEVDNG